MAHWLLLLLGLVSALLIKETQLQEIDCNTPPPRGAGIHSCCKIPRPKVEAFGACENFFKQKGSMGCAFNCVMNTTGALENDRLNMNNLRALLTKAYDDDVVIEAFVQGFQRCEQEVKKNGDSSSIDADTDNLNDAGNGGRGGGRRGGSWKSVGGEQCPELAKKLIFCTQGKVFADCPSKYWTASQECESAKAYMSACGHQKRGGGMRMQKGMGNRRGGG